MQKNILVIYYTQTGQLEDIVKNIAQPFEDKKDEYKVTYYNIQLKKDFPFPWPSDVFFNTFPESYLQIPSEILPPPQEVLNTKFDLILFGYQVWYLTPSIPIISFLKSGFAADILKNTPVVTISAPSESWGIQATALAEVTNGSVTAIEIVSSGRGYTTAPTITIAGPDVGINTATGTLELLPTYYTIVSSTPISSGVSTITINDNVPYVVGVGSTVPFFKQSRVLASGHSFEYIGSGTNINAALPAQGGVPIQDNEVDMRNGGLVVFTSTDQSGNFRIGDGVVVNQTTGTISGASYSRSLFSSVTPFILALGGE